MTTQAEVDREIDRFIGMAVRYEVRRDTHCVFESPEYWWNHDKAMEYHERARRLMPKGA